MIAHLISKIQPPKTTKAMACSQCGEPTRTECHGVVYCLICGYPIPVPAPEK